MDKIKNSKARRIAVIISIITAAVILGISINLFWSALDKAIHPYEYSEHVKKYSQEYNISESVIYAIIKVESNFDPLAKSSVGACGLMQIMPKTFEWLTSDDHLGENLDTEMLFDPETNIKYGTYYLSYLYKKFDYNMNTALAAYNGGEGNVAKWLKDPEYSDGNGNLTSIPFSETSNYVYKVNKEIAAYKEIYYDKDEETEA